MFALSSETPLEGLARVTREVNALEAERIQLAADYERSRVWTNKYRNAACGIADACNVTEGIARIWLEIAHTLEELPQTSDAFDNGDISSDKVKTISKAAKPERMEKLAERESDLLDAAKNSNSKKFTDEVKSLTDEIDGDNGLSEDERAFAQRGFDLVKNDGLMKPAGNGFDQESGEIIATSLAFEKERDFVKGDTRTIAQRNADAMRNICQWYLDHHAESTAKRSQPHVLLVHDVEQRGLDGELLKQARTEATHSDRISQSTLERMMCDAAVTTVLTDSHGCVLNVGRANRFPTQGQWNALVARDRSCVGCGRSPRYCQAHHKRYWERGGPTDLDNLELRCWQCHREVHRCNRPPGNI
jgi:hypothetical protein